MWTQGLRHEGIRASGHGYRHGHGDGPSHTKAQASTYIMDTHMAHGNTRHFETHIKLVRDMDIGLDARIETSSIHLD